MNEMSAANVMNVMNDSLEASLPLAPEQRTVPAGAARLRLLAWAEGAVDPQRLRAAVERVLRAHGALCVAIRQVPGYRGLRQQPLDQPPPLNWQSIELDGADEDAMAAWLDAFHAEPLAMERGELAAAALLRAGAARHALALSVNPLVADRESLRSLFDQIASACASDDGAGLEDVFQYDRFVAWRQDLREGEEAAEGAAYWRRHVAGGEAPPHLNVRRNAAPEKAVASARHVVSSAGDAAFAGRITARADELGVQPETLLQATWWLLLARLNGPGRFIGGWQHDCRRDYEPMRGAVGVFDKVLPVVVGVAEGSSFARWVAELDRTLSEHIDAQEYWPVDAPLVGANLAVGFASHEAVPRREGGVQWQLAGLPAPMPCFELALQAEWSAQGATLSLHTDRSCYSRAAAQRLLMQFTALLEAVVAQPDAPVDTLSLVGPAERELLLAQNEAQSDARNDARNDAQVGTGIHGMAQRIAHWARTTPDAPALEAGAQRLSYRAFDQRIDRLAHWLVGQGVTPGSLVALKLPRSADLPVAMFAAWRAGAAYLPLEPDWPEARRAAVLADAQPRLVLDAASLERAWADLAAQAAQAAQATPETRATDAPAAHTSSLHDLAYVLYTSGSTGTPKGVAIEQGHLLNYVVAASAAMRLATCRRWALTSSVVADLGNTALFGAFFNGACLVVAQDHETKDADAFAHFMAAHDIDAVKIVPSHLEALLECAAPRLPRTLVLGGEAAPRALVERIARLAPQCAVFNHYGPTEATVGVMVHAVRNNPQAGDVGESESEREGEGESEGEGDVQLPLSQVLANNRVHVLDASLRLVPAGGMGEVFIGGAQLCRGYLNREPGEAFVADPFRPGERLYRTGDLAHVLPEGGIRLAGRADHQVKVQGFRVEPAEIELALLAQPGVRQAVVLAVPGAGGATMLAAFYVAGLDVQAGANAAPVDARALREQLAASLPAHMVPASFTAVAAFARLPNGKIDRLALASLALATTSSPDSAGTAAGGGHHAPAAPRDALEAVIAHGMAALLGSGPIGVEDDFFELGGHSLQVIKLVARMRKLLQVEVAAGAVFDHPTPAALAAALREASDDAQALEQRAQAHRQPEAQGEAA